MEKLKQIIWNLMGHKGQRIYVFEKMKKKLDYKRFAADIGDGKKRVILLDTPQHGNLGDHAIVSAMKKFMMTYFPESEIYEFSFDECTYCMDKIAGKIQKDDILLIPGGGFIGTLWKKEQENVLRILETCADYPVVIFPQTLYFDASAEGKMELERFCTALKKCKNVTLFVRDKKSYDFVQKKGIDKLAETTLVPDIVTWLSCDNAKVVHREKKVLFCLRNDLEKSVDTGRLDKIRKELIHMGYEIAETSTVLEKSVSGQERQKEIQDKLCEFSKAGLVITDRLHGMIFSAVTSTPCIAMDNLSQKVSGGYDWIKHLEYVQMIQPENILLDGVRKMLDYNGCGYNKKPLEPYYGQIRNIIASVWRT